VLYVASGDGSLLAIDPAAASNDPRPRWSYCPQPSAVATWSTPAIARDGAVYAGYRLAQGTGELYAIDPRAADPSGRVQWFAETRDEGRSAPAVGASGKVYASSQAGGVYAFNPQAVDPLQPGPEWRCLASAPIGVSPAIGADGAIYAGGEDGFLHAIDPRGNVRWSLQTGGSVTAPPAIGGDGVIYVASTGADSSGEFGILLAVSPRDGRDEVLWSLRLGRSLLSLAVAADGAAYAGSNDGVLYAVDTGAALSRRGPKWTFRTGGGLYGAPAIGADGTIYIGSSDKRLYAINPDGTEKWSYPTGDAILSAPAIGADGTLYISSTDGYLYAFGR
jgi:outer membrane protein assembly factor BamB